MPCGAILYLDLETDRTVRGLWQSIEDAGLPSTSLELNYPPHVTLLVCEDLDLDSLRKVLPRFVAEHPPLLVDFTGLGVFGGKDATIYLSIAWNAALLELHSKLWEIAAPHVKDGNEHYHPGSWVPHVTLDYGLPYDEVGAVIEILLHARLPAHGLLRELVLVDFNPDESLLEERFKTRLGRYL